MSKNAERLARMLTYILFGTACLALGFLGNSAYTEQRLASEADPERYWGQRAQFFAAPSFGGFIDKYVAGRSMSVRRDKTLMTFRLVDTTRYLMKPDVTEIAEGAEVQVKYRNNPDLPGVHTALTVRLLSRSMFK